MSHSSQRCALAAMTVLGALSLAACGTAQPSGAATPAHGPVPAHAAAGTVAVSDPAAAGATGAASAGIEKDLATAEHLYYNEIYGPRVHHDLQFVADDGRLVRLLEEGRYASAQSVAYRLMRDNAIRHITRISFVRGGHELIDAVWNANGAFVAAPDVRALRVHGQTLGRLQVSVQDIVGYVKLITRYSPAQAVVRGASGQVRSSLPAAEAASLPSSGTVTIAGVTYRVGSFDTYAWGRRPGDEPLTVWVLEAL